VLVPPDDPPGLRRRRILRGLVREVGGLALLTLLFPLLVVMASAVDLALWLRRRWRGREPEPVRAASEPLREPVPTR